MTNQRSQMLLLNDVKVIKCHRKHWEPQFRYRKLTQHPIITKDRLFVLRNVVCAW